MRCSQKNNRYEIKLIEQVMQDHRNGMTYTEVVEKYGISIATFYRWRRKHGYTNEVNLHAIHELQQERDLLRRENRELSQKLQRVEKGQYVGEQPLGAIAGNDNIYEIKEVRSNVAKGDRESVIVNRILDLASSNASLGFNEIHERMEREGLVENILVTKRLCDSLDINFDGFAGLGFTELESVI